jgi:hypothetical protein
MSSNKGNAPLYVGLIALAGILAMTSFGPQLLAGLR